MIKVNLCVDGNYILYKSVFMLRQTRTIDIDLEDLLHIEFNKIIRSYTYDNVYFVSDMGASWRKELFHTYKEGRKKDEKIDWDNVHNIFDGFKDELSEKQNINMYEIPKIEGDDIIAYIVNKSNEKGYSNVIIGNDKDLHQLLRFDLNKNYINILWNFKMSDERSYFPENYQIFFDSIENGSNEIDLFEENDFDSDFINFLEGLNGKTKLFEVNNEEALFTKIVSGDNSDKIDSIYKKNDRGIGEKGADKIYKLYKDIYPEPIDFNDDNFLRKLVGVVAYSKKFDDNTEKKAVYLNAKDNRMLIKLDEKYMPGHLYGIMSNKVKIII